MLSLPPCGTVAVLLLIGLAVPSMSAPTPAAYPFQKAADPAAGCGQVRYVYDKAHASVPLDHFDFTVNDRFKLRYLVNDKFFDKHAGAIFLYTGNEGDIEWFARNTGAMWEMAPQYNAMLLFIEHRYFGESMPFGNESFTGNNPRYLSTEQALADFAVVTQALQEKLGLQDVPVIAFGGSYGGMLAAWMRAKYPNIVAGAISASAPVAYFKGQNKPESFYRIVTDDFKQQDDCDQMWRKVWPAVAAATADAEGREELEHRMRLCKPLPADSKQASALVNGWLMNAVLYAAMVDYPYAASFLEPLPAWPVEAMCQAMKRSSSIGDDELKWIDAATEAAGVYFNYTGQAECFQLEEEATSDLGIQGWDWLSCTEMVMPMSTNGVNDMFPAGRWDEQAFAESCEQRWGVQPRPSWAAVHFGGRDVSTVTNVVFTNGALDPWLGGGITSTQTPSSPAIVIEKGAHHLDLRCSNPSDPASVLSARAEQKRRIRIWMAEHRYNRQGEIHEVAVESARLHTTVIE